MAGVCTYVIGHPKKSEEVREVAHVPDSTAWAAPFSSGLILTFYDQNMVEGKNKWQLYVSFSNL
jgi:hypothetical protein